MRWKIFMIIHPRNRKENGTNGAHWPKVVLLASFLLIHVGNAQPIVAPLDTGLEPSPGNESIRQEGLSGSWAEGASLRSGPIAPLQWGPFNVRPHVIYRILYGNGIQTAPGHSSSTTINSFSPGLLVELGTHWTFDYTPTWNEYSSHDFKDTLDHLAKLAWGTTFQGWVLRASEDYNRSNSPSAQTGQQTRETDYVTNIDASYLFAGDLISETVLNRSLRFVKGFNDTRDWSVLELLHLQLSPQIDSALGLEYGRTTTSNSPEMDFVQYLARVAWQVARKLSLELQAGLEDRHIKLAGVENVRGPVANAAIHYRPVETTQISFNASRGTSASFFANQIVKNSQYGFLLEQRLLRHFRLTAGADYQESKYRSILPTLAVDRSDKIYSYTAGLRTAVLRRLDLTLEYRKSHNTSNIAGFGFSSNQVSLEVGYRY
jgi:Putative beta-barrel porin 2